MTTEPEDGDPFYQTKSVRVVWIPPRKSEFSWTRGMAMLDVVAVVLIAGLTMRFSGVRAPGRAVAQSDSVEQSAAHIDTKRAVAASIPAPMPAFVPPSDRASLVREISRCKNPEAACSVDRVLLLGRELVAQRRAPPPRGQHGH